MKYDIKNDYVYFYIIDMLASEYGWTIEYIEKLTMYEIAGLIKVILERKGLDDQRQQINIIKALAGKVSPNWQPRKSESERLEDEAKNFELLKRLLEKAK